jgi:hypothetical protein
MKKNLKQIWEESHNNIEKEKLFIYNEILDAMKNNKTFYTVPVSLIHVDVIMDWLKKEHDLTCCIKIEDGGCNPSTHDRFEIKMLYVSW